MNWNSVDLLTDHFHKYAKSVIDDTSSEVAKKTIQEAQWAHSRNGRTLIFWGLPRNQRCLVFSLSSWMMK